MQAVLGFFFGQNIFKNTTAKSLSSVTKNYLFHVFLFHLGPLSNVSSHHTCNSPQSDILHMQTFIKCVYQSHFSQIFSRLSCLLLEAPPPPPQ
ncbi:hypothetical protein GDO81_015175 [Engystomops pustulosus]|uniref:Uncharacterized protein n=1 Tax=Engystomops pustulosus TaxID=76066 RepID=A0AAV7AH85_ENGPU|nr:hypothetical protein GDO81_015175 [Engystomops pustulosus]